jgi:hypothetical protein
MKVLSEVGYLDKGALSLYTDFTSIERKQNEDEKITIINYNIF